MIKEFIEMKKKEIRVKTALYSAVDKFIVEKQDMLDLVMRIFNYNWIVFRQIFFIKRLLI